MEPTKDETQKPVNITLPLPIYLDDKLGKDKWCAPILSIIGEVIAKKLDVEEKYCHVEFYDPTAPIDYLVDSGAIIFECQPSKESPAIIWRIKEWRDSVTYRERRRADISKDTERYKYMNKKIAELSLAIHEMTALPMIDHCIPLATKLVTTKNIIAAKNFGVKLE